MVRRGRRRRVDPSLASKYHRVARALLRSAADLSELAEDGDTYGNAIAYADALCIAYAGFKSTEGEHERAAEALADALGARADAAAVKLLCAPSSARTRSRIRGSTIPWRMPGWSSNS